MGKGKLPFKENHNSKPTGLKCFCCFQISHKSNECPALEQVQVMEGEIKENNMTEPENEKTEIEEVGGDEEEALVRVLEILLIAPKQCLQSQRYTKFRTRCIINGKVCDLLIAATPRISYHVMSSKLYTSKPQSNLVHVESVG